MSATTSQTKLAGAAPAGPLPATTFILVADGTAPPIGFLNRATAAQVAELLAPLVGAILAGTSTPTPAPAPAPAPTETGTLSGVPTAGTAGTALATSGTFSLTNAPSSGTTAYVGLFNVTAGAYQGALQAVTGSSGGLPTLTPASAAGAATYAVRLCADSAGATVLAISPNIAVVVAAAAPPPTPAPSGGTIAPDGTLTGLPSTIVAGQPLSAVTYAAGQTNAYFVLYKVAGAVEEGLRWGTNVMPGNLNLLIPQTAGAYTVRGYSAVTGGSVVYESAQFNVTAAPAPLPATPTQAADTGTTSSGTTMNWSATATSYRVLARPGVGSVYGSLADATVSTNSYTFTGLAASSSPRAVVIPQNANGYGTPSGQFLSYTTA